MATSVLKNNTFFDMKKKSSYQKLKQENAELKANIELMIEFKDHFIGMQIEDNYRYMFNINGYKDKRDNDKKLLKNI